ncbi:hypothetical protein MKW98_022577 [Papaver atlanticum]|uniref:ABC transporter domain-containing protein n=1 Tax=Papaver atlanticum TaxID=357466 RepID=A0AAD4SLE2_9MAGN|nr:hypothetical protein MKW98_022577 [Papaver atlanticum]
MCIAGNNKRHCKQLLKFKCAEGHLVKRDIIASKGRQHLMEGEFTDSQIFVMLGENGTGKTTFICMLVGL